MNIFTVFFPLVLFAAGSDVFTVILSPFNVIVGGVLAILMYTDRTPFPGHSLQWHTRGGFRYRFIEMFWSWPRDFLASAKKFR